ncbi:MAG: PAS domain S-box protein [Desulfobacteraceae bacterium]|jgi:PAS domain S-box-containing protein
MTKQPTYDQLLNEIDELNESVKLYRTIVENSPDMLYRTDLQGFVSYVSPSSYRMTGYTTEEAIGLNLAEDGYLFPREREIFLSKLQETGYVTNFEARLKRKDGSIFWASTNAHFIKDKAGNVIGVEGVTRDISELKAAEEALRKSEERFRLAFHTSPDAIILSRASDGMHLDINEGFTKIMGYKSEEVIGMTSLALNIWKNPDDRKHLVDELSKMGYVENIEAEFVAKNGKTRIGLMSARLFKLDEEDVILSIIRDITEHKKMEQQLHQANKLQALGTLAGGIAHNFNNLLMGIQGHASLIRIRSIPNFGHDLSKHVHGIEQCVQSAAHLTNQLLGLARGGKYEIKPIDMNELLLNSANMFGRTRKEIQIHTKLHHEQIVVNADQNQIEQVLLNLFVNAWQAMPNGGDLYLETSLAALDEAYCQSHKIDPGCFCKISVTDTGIGMDEETRQRVFDPFFSTKETERGTGLGLACVYGIVKNHAGLVNVSSEINCGTTFNIYLPSTSVEVIKEVEIKEKPIKGSETILLVDDETMVVDVGKPMLETLGYQVFVSKNGQEAIDLVMQHGAAIDLVILDLIMPGLDGGQVFDRIRNLQPDMPVMLSSGYSLNGQASDIINRGCDGFIQKPFSLSKLSQKIRQILDKRR